MHTLFCGQRRYTMPAIVLPAGTNYFVEPVNNPPTYTELKIMSIKPPGGLVLSAKAVAGDPSIRVRFTTEKGEIILCPTDEPTLYLFDGIIEKVEYVKNGLDYLQYWLVPDVAYLVEVEKAYGTGHCP